MNTLGFIVNTETVEANAILAGFTLATICSGILLMMGIRELKKQSLT